MYVAHRLSDQAKPLLLCLSHLRWNFVFQRPQHLLSCAAADYRVVFFEEPVPSSDAVARLQSYVTPQGILVVTPALPPGLDPADTDAAQRSLLDGLLGELAADVAVVWYYTPMAVSFAGHLRPEVTVFDAMDELSAFQGASPRLALLERRLLKQADLVFTGGRSLHEAKRRLHRHTHLFPSSVDAAHYRSARGGPGLGLGPGPGSAEPADQADIPHPRLGYFGVIDERVDYAMLDGLAAARPDWHIVMVGPTVKVDPATLPRRANLHWLGMKAYAELPAYLAGWDAGLMPFALNEATRYISPTKTPEFLAAGVPLASTAIPDVVSEWDKDGMVLIAGDIAGMVVAVETLLARPRKPWLDRVDQQLARMSWTATWAGMRGLIEEAQDGTDLLSAAPEGSVLG